MKYRIFFAFFTVLLISGCSYANEPEVVDDTEIEGFWEEAVYDVNFEKPDVLPKVLVNRDGYELKSEKEALFRGENLSGTFKVIDEKTHKVIYEGKIEKAEYDDVNDEYISKGDFTEVETPGTYYLETAVIGQSYPFEIKQNAHQSIYEGLIDSFYYHRCGMDLSGKANVSNHKACHTNETKIKDGSGAFMNATGGWHTGNNFEKDVVEGCKIVSDLLLTYEIIGLRGSSKEDEKSTFELENTLKNEVKYELEWLFLMQNTENGSIYSGVYPIGEFDGADPNLDKREFYVGAVSREATAEFAAAMALAERTYKIDDAEFAKKCFNASQSAYEYLVSEGIEDDLLYYAAAELYKTTGKAIYSQQIKLYHSNENAAKNSKFNRELYGNVAYMTTQNYKVDVEICNNLMESLMGNAEKAAKETGENPYMTWLGENGYDTQVILENAFVISIVDYVIVSHEYKRIISNQIHYLLGRNENGVEMISSRGVLSFEDGKKDYKLHLQATLYFILCGLIESEETV